MSTLSPDPIAREIGVITGRGYEDARLALRWLENHGWTTYMAREFLIKEWTLGKSLEQMAHAATAVPPPRITETKG